MLNLRSPSLDSSTLRTWSRRLILVINVLTIENDLITEVWAMGDELGRLMQLEALVSLSPQAAGTRRPPMNLPDMAE